ncbi:MAG: hypothetical protein RJA21_260 [Gemmatimonadota bacterium]|jgi:hypothetical protein
MSEDSQAIRRTLSNAAAERNRLHDLGARRPEAAPELIAAYAASGEFLDRLTSDDALARLRARDPVALEHAACFLEVYPHCPDSGFAVRDLVKTFKHAYIPENFTGRLRAALLAIAAQPPRDELKHLRQLALKVADEAFVADLDKLGESRDLVAAANARLFADYITKHWENPPWETK